MSKLLRQPIDSSRAVLQEAVVPARSSAKDVSGNTYKPIQIRPRAMKVLQQHALKSSFSPLFTIDGDTTLLTNWKQYDPDRSKAKERLSRIINPGRTRRQSKQIPSFPAKNHVWLRAMLTCILEHGDKLPPDAKAVQEVQDMDVCIQGKGTKKLVNFSMDGKSHYNLIFNRINDRDTWVNRSQFFSSRDKGQQAWDTFLRDNPPIANDRPPLTPISGFDSNSSSTTAKSTAGNNTCTIPPTPRGH